MCRNRHASSRTLEGKGQISRCNVAEERQQQIQLEDDKPVFCSTAAILRFSYFALISSFNLFLSLRRFLVVFHSIGSIPDLTLSPLLSNLTSSLSASQLNTALIKSIHTLVVDTNS